MKKFFAMAMAVVAMAVSMVSCNNDDAEFIEQPAPAAVQQETKMMDLDFVVAVTPAQQTYFDESYEIEFGGDLYTVALSDMKPATAEQMAAFTSPRQVADAAEIGEVVYYAFTLGQVNTYKGAKILSHNVEVKADHPTDQAYAINAACFVVNGRVTSNRVETEAHGIEGTDDVKLYDYAQKLSERRY